MLIYLHTVDAKMPVNETAVGVVEEVRLISAGPNLAMLNEAIGRPEQNKKEFSVVYTSSLNNTQNDGAFIELGVITNTGMMQPVCHLYFNDLTSSQ